MAESRHSVAVTLWCTASG